MESLWNDSEASSCKTSLDLRVYTSRLLGRSSELVLHGGGNTSVKETVANLFGDQEEILFVKGSGWDLISIEKEGFAPVRMNTLLKMAELDHLSDSDMVKYQRAAMIDPGAPNPSVEAILHAVIPYKFVDHTHADSVVTITNTPDGIKLIKEIYGDTVLVVPYVMPGFILAKEIYKLIKNIDLSRYQAIILMNHGVFTFDDSAKDSYVKMIQTVDLAEKYLKQKASIRTGELSGNIPLLELAAIRRQVSLLKGSPVIALMDRSDFAANPHAQRLSAIGPLTPDHVIRTKKDACYITAPDDVPSYEEKYRSYFQRNRNDSLTCLDPAPCWAVWKDKGTLSFGATISDALIIKDIKDHTIPAILKAEMLGGYRALIEKDIFEMEYWELEQAKLKKSQTKPELQGKIALVTGAASGIGKACVMELQKKGACVLAADISPAITTMYASKQIKGICGDLTKEEDVKNIINETILRFGGLDILINNAGIFPPGMNLEEMDMGLWQKSMDINLTAQQLVLKECIPFLRLGFDPAVIFIVSKNVPAPGKGAGAYSVAKAGAAQLARLAAIELAPHIRVNMLHPDAVFDTGIWSDEVIAKRAKSYNMTVDEYKRRNLLKTEVTSAEVASLACALAGKLFLKSTGVQIPIDGGNDRVI